MALSYHNVVGLLFPNVCICCGKPVSPPAEFCAECLPGVRPIFPPFCPACGANELDCRCNKRGHAYNQSVAPFYYEASVRNAILRFKFGGHEEVSRFFGRTMGRTIGAYYFGIPFDIVAPVPATKEKTAKRGFNQAQSLIEHVPKDTFYWQDMPDIDPHLLLKNPTEEEQHFLGAEARRKNIRNAYTLNKYRNVTGKNILLVDDIVTTGATAHEIAALLKLWGAKGVYVASAARTRKTDTKV